MLAVITNKQKERKEGEEKKGKRENRFRAKFVSPISTFCFNTVVNMASSSYRYQRQADEQPFSSARDQRAARRNALRQQHEEKTGRSRSPSPEHDFCIPIFDDDYFLEEESIQHLEDVMPRYDDPNVKDPDGEAWLGQRYSEALYDRIVLVANRASEAPEGLCYRLLHYRNQHQPLQRLITSYDAMLAAFTERCQAHPKLRWEALLPYLQRRFNEVCVAELRPAELLIADEFRRNLPNRKKPVYEALLLPYLCFFMTAMKEDTWFADYNDFYPDRWRAYNFATTIETPISPWVLGVDFITWRRMRFPELSVAHKQFWAELYGVLNEIATASYCEVAALDVAFSD